MAVDELPSNASEGEDENPDGSQIRTEFLLGERLLNGTESKFVGLPTPYSLLHHPYFQEYLPSADKARRPAATFTWTTRYDPALDCTKPKEAKEGKKEKRGKAAGEKAKDGIPPGKTSPAREARKVQEQKKAHEQKKAQELKAPLGNVEARQEKPKPALKRKAGDNDEHQKSSADSSPMPVPQPVQANGIPVTKRVPVLRAGPTPPKGRNKSRH
jgi:hypothetical protein